MENTANLDEINKEIKETLRNLSDKYSISFVLTGAINHGDKYTHIKAIKGNFSDSVNALSKAIKDDYIIRRAVCLAMAKFGMEYREEEEEEEEEK